MFGLNDVKSTGQDPVMPQALESPEPDVAYVSNQDTGSAPPMGSSQQAPPPAYSPVTHPPTSAPTIPVTGNPTDELLQIKQQALNSLAPLVGQLDQTPEEKFKTTMMMLQASDNPQLVKNAYAAANQISDEKTRAQALLDVVNEINYFTHHDAA